MDVLVGRWITLLISSGICLFFFRKKKSKVDFDQILKEFLTGALKHFLKDLVRKMAPDFAKKNFL